MFSADPNHQCCSNVRRGRELQCSSSQIDCVVPSSITQFLAFLDVRSRDFVGVLSVVIPRAARYESGIKRRTDHEGDVLALAADLKAQNLIEQNPSVSQVAPASVR